MANENQDDNIGSFYMGRVRPPPAPKRFLPPGVLTAIALAVLAGIVWYAYPRGAGKYNNADVPVIHASTAAIKSAPASPGGMKISHQDSTAFNPLLKNSGNAPEKLMPPPPKPVDKTAAIKALQAQMAAPAKMDMQVREKAGGVEELVPPPTARPPVTVASASAAHKVKTVTALPATASARENGHHAAAPKTAAVKLAPKAAPAPDSQTATGANFEVQLGSYRAIADAKNYWDHARGKFSHELSSLKMRVVRADIPGRGIYYRLQAGPVTKEAGHAICGTLKEARRPCILAKR